MRIHTRKAGTNKYLPALLVVGLASWASCTAGHPAITAAPQASTIGAGLVFCEPNNIDDPDGGQWFPNPPGCPAGWHEA